MKKFLLSLTFVLLAGVATAQTVDLTFTRTGTQTADVSITETGDTDVSGISASIGCNIAYKELSFTNNHFNADNILCPDRNTKLMKDGNEGVFTIAISDFPTNFKFNTITFTSAALNSSGVLQDHNTSSQQIDFTLKDLKNNGEIAGEEKGISIKVNSNEGETVEVAFEGIELVKDMGAYLFTLTLTNNYDELGCFYGLTKVSFSYVELLQEEERAEALTFFDEYQGMIGYPTDDVISTYKAAIESAITPNDVETAKQAVYASTDINMPVNNRPYIITFVQRSKEDEADSGKEYYVNCTGEALELVERTAESVIPRTAFFTTRLNDDGTYTILTYNNKYVQYPKRSNGIATAEDDYTKIEIAKILGDNSYVYGGNESLFGLTRFKSLNAENSYRYFVVNGDDGTWDTSSSYHFEYNDNDTRKYSSAARIEPADVYSYTLAQIKAGDLNSMTEATTIAIKNVSKGNSYWLAGLQDAADFSESVLLTWEPSEQGVTGKYNLKTSAGYFKNQTTNDTAFELTENQSEAAVFEAFNPTLSAGTSDPKRYFSGDDKDEASYANILSADDPKLVRFVTIQGDGYGYWLNCASTIATTKYYNGTGGFAIQNVYKATKVEEFTVNISTAKFATFYAPTAVILPSNATAYIIDGSGEGDYLTLKETTGILPANTGVILYSEVPVTCKLAVTMNDATADVTNNKLTGTMYDRYISLSNSNYFLAKHAEKGVGLYNVSKDEGASHDKHIINANKAYLVMSEASSSTGFRLSFGDLPTTAIEEVESENGDVKAIYDLQGRRIDEIAKPGIYIVNGKKIIVK